MSDPAKYTKAKLKEELKAHNIALPKVDSKKQVYVDLYREYILKEVELKEEDEEGETETDIPEQEGFSAESESDTEVVFKTPQVVTSKSRRTLSKVEEKLVEKLEIKKEKVDTKMDLAEIKEYSDVDLLEELRSCGINPGPITATTRKVYEKKLLKLRHAGGDTVEIAEKPVYEEVPDDEENSPPPKPRSSPKKPRTQNSTLTRRTIATGSTESQDNTQSTTRTTRMSSAASPLQNSPPPQPQSSPPSQNDQERRGMATWVRILILLIVAFFVYLVYINMEPSGSKVPKALPGEN